MGDSGLQLGAHVLPNLLPPELPGRREAAGFARQHVRRARPYAPVPAQRQHKQPPGALHPRLHLSPLRREPLLRRRPGTLFSCFEPCSGGPIRFTTCWLVCGGCRRLSRDICGENGVRAAGSERGGVRGAGHARRAPAVRAPARMDHQENALLNIKQAVAADAEAWWLWCGSQRRSMLL